MRSMPTHEYGGYTVVANTIPAPENRFYSVFSIHRGQENILLAGVVHQQGKEADFICETDEDALNAAVARAHEWIDANPVE